MDDSDSKPQLRKVRCNAMNERMVSMIEDMKKMVPYQPVTTLCNYEGSLPTTPPLMQVS